MRFENFLNGQQYIFYFAFSSRGFGSLRLSPLADSAVLFQTVYHEYSGKIFIVFFGVAAVSCFLVFIYVGICISREFNYLNKAVSIKGFWRRWQVSLNSWFQDYVYILLGGKICHVYTSGSMDFGFSFSRRSLLILAILYHFIQLFLPAPHLEFIFLTCLAGVPDLLIGIGFVNFLTPVKSNHLHETTQHSGKYIWTLFEE